MDKTKYREALVTAIRIRDQIEMGSNRVYAVGGTNCPTCGYTPKEGYQEMTLIINALQDGIKKISED